MFFSMQIPIKFQMSHSFRNSSLAGIIWVCLITKRMKRNLEFRNEHSQQNILPRTMEWLREATNALKQEDSPLNKGLNNSFLNYSRCFFYLGASKSIR